MVVDPEKGPAFIASSTGRRGALHKIDMRGWESRVKEEALSSNASAGDAGNGGATGTWLRRRGLPGDDETTADPEGEKGWWQLEKETRPACSSGNLTDGNAACTGGFPIARFMARYAGAEFARFVGADTDSSRHGWQ